MIDNVQALIEAEEGRRHRAYDDGDGNMTIGIGHLIRPTEKYLLETILSDEQIDNLFAQDLAICTADCRDLFLNFASLDRVRQAALQSAMFNMGKPNFTEFHKFVQAMARHDFDEAKLELLDSDAARNPLLVKRYNILANMIQTGEWQ